MAARVLIVKNIQREGPGLLRDVLQQHHIGADVIELERGDRIPPLGEYAAMFVLGGPASANDNTDIIRHQLERAGEALAMNIPYFGICLGMQLLVKAAGGNVVAAPEPEIGFDYSVQLNEAGKSDPLFASVPDRFRVFQLHGETVATNGVIHTLGTGVGGSSEQQIVKVGRNAYGMQAHIEVVPEMLAVWGAQDAMLAGKDMAAMQNALSAISETYQANARRIFQNFLVLADLITSVDITESQSRSAHA
jgi:GMP synthase (glutamine-hydrolysing)